MSLGPSAHLAWWELACRDGTPYPTEWRVVRGEPLALEFEAIRALVGGPIPVNSAYRTLDHNRKSKSKPTSQHVQGRALDLGLPSGLTLLEFRVVVLEVAHRPGGRVRGVGVYPNGSFVHIDIRPSVRLARWSGSRAVAEVA